MQRNDAQTGGVLQDIEEQANEDQPRKMEMCEMCKPRKIPPGEGKRER